MGVAWKRLGRGAKLEWSRARNGAELKMEQRQVWSRGGGSGAEAGARQRRNHTDPIPADKIYFVQLANQLHFPVESLPFCKNPHMTHFCTTSSKHGS